jgi:hypothetical protein
LIEREIQRALLPDDPELEKHLAVLHPITREFGLELLRLYAPVADLWLILVRDDKTGCHLPDEVIVPPFVLPTAVLLAEWGRWLQERQRQFTRLFPQSVRRQMVRLARELSNLPISGQWRPTGWIRDVQSWEQTAAAFHACLKAKAMQPYLRRSSKNKALTASVIQLLRVAKANGISTNQARRSIATGLKTSVEALKGRARRARLTGSA